VSAAAGQHLAAASGGHAGAESMTTGADDFAGLERALHGFWLSSREGRASRGGAAWLSTLEGLMGLYFGRLEWSFSGMEWNPGAYLNFADERTRPAADLLARVRVASPQRVVDLGCGPGNSTGLLAARWPGAEVVGVDSSAAMLAQAARSGVRARWVEADLNTWVPEVAYDLVFSNATFQWLGEHRVLLPRLMGFVRPGGVFAFQVPENFSAASHRLMREVAASGPWSEKLRDVREGSVLSAEDYYGIVSPLARSVDVWQTTYLHVLDGDDPVLGWVRATGLRPFVQALEGGERAGFLEAYRARLRVAYPKRADGRTLFAFRRLFVVAEV